MFSFILKFIAQIKSPKSTCKENSTGDLFPVLEKIMKRSLIVGKEIYSWKINLRKKLVTCVGAGAGPLKRGGQTLFLFNFFRVYHFYI